MPYSMIEALRVAVKSRNLPYKTIVKDHHKNPKIIGIVLNNGGCLFRTYCAILKCAQFKMVIKKNGNVLLESDDDKEIIGTVFKFTDPNMWRNFIKKHGGDPYYLNRMGKRNQRLYTVEDLIRVSGMEFELKDIKNEKH